MATIIQIKRSSGTSKPAELAQGELAYAYGVGGSFGEQLFLGTGTETEGVAASIDVIGGKYFTDKLDHAIGTLTASSAILVDSNSRIDTIFVGNNVSNGGGIRFYEGTNNGNNFVTIKSPNSLSEDYTITLPSVAGSNGQFLKTDGSGNLSFAAVPSGSFTISDDSSTDVSFTTGETLRFTGGTGITSVVTDSGEAGATISFDIDNTVATLAGTQELSNKTINSASNTITLNLSQGTLTGTLAEFNTAVSDATLVSTTGTETLSNKTLTAPKFVDGGFIADANGNELILLQTTTSAVNELEITNAATGNAVQIATSGGDTNIDLKLSPKGSGVVDVDSSRITNVTDPSSAQDAATKAYVDSVANGLDVKASVRVATTTSLPASTYNNGAATITADSNGALEIDGVTVSVDDRVLVKNQSAEASVQNGLYKVTATGSGAAAWVLTRTPDGDEAIEITGGAFVFVEEGSANADNGYVFTHNGTPTLGTDPITVAQFSGAGQISAGSALTKTGNTLDVAVDDTTIEVSGDALRLKADGVGTNQLATDSVTTVKITDGNVTNAKLANSSISISDESSTTGTVSLGQTLEFLTGEGIDTSVEANRLTISAELATTSNKGVASFSSDNFTVTTGVVTVTSLDGGTYP